MSTCKDCFHSYVCEQFNEHRDCDNKKCHFANDHFVPAEDVTVVKHGKWLYHGTDDNDMVVVKCSECNTKRYGTQKYCGECGAKMDGERKEDENA